ncbi:TadE/TadG family type IV pilus assembly protein [Roseovarius sp. E0-M6]|uniref:TadE/TadG family type IV pilus assembly protein n=1 Tax=Roseovarius sp. E0-M6 TaxID=3127118 RepID=UPI00300F9CD4
MTLSPHSKLFPADTLTERSRSRFDRIKRHARTFRRDEDGTVTILSLFFFLIMIAAGGIAIDMMRYEMERARIQTTLDSAVLAAAGSPFGSDSRTIVEDYFETAGMSDYLNAEEAGDITSTVTASKVKASASMTMNTYLMKLSGVKTLSTSGSSVAERRVPKLEVVLVLDVSGSMGRNSKLTNLKSAAKDFVSTVLSSSEQGNTVISLVPFSWSVTPTNAMYSALAIEETHQYSTCLRFKDNDYNHASLASGSSGFSSGVPIDQMVYTSVYGGFENFDSSGWRSCYAEDYMEILPYSASETALHNKIDAFQASGNTSGHQGMNWGAALLDPTFRDITDDLITAGEVDASLSDIPSNYDQGETLKIIVMMGDGQNTSSYFFRTGGHWRGQNSDLYLVKTQERVFEYAYHKYKKNKTSNNESRCSHHRWECVYSNTGTIESTYYLEYNNEYYNIDDRYWITSGDFSDIQNDTSFVSLERLSWEQAWGLMTPEFYRDVTGDWSAFNDYTGNPLTGSTKNTHMLNSCAATKREGVVVYSIGFEISRGGTAETTLKDCASSYAHYYRAEGISINDAFSSIASNVVNLRLTQ